MVEDPRMVTLMANTLILFVQQNYIGRGEHAVTSCPQHGDIYIYIYVYMGVSRCVEEM